MIGAYVHNCDNYVTNIALLDIPKEVVDISIQSCRLTDIPVDFFMQFDLLESLNLQNNEIISIFELPPNLTYTRIVSTLVAFDPNIKMEVSFAVRFSNIVDLYKKNGNFNRESLTEFVKGSELSTDEQKVWISAIEDLL
jgi:hypothetical protein